MRIDQFPVAWLRKIRPHWVDPNGRVNMTNVVADANLLLQAGVIPEVPNLSNA